MASLPLLFIILSIFQCNRPWARNCPECFPLRCTPTKLTGTGIRKITHEVQQVGGCTKAIVEHKGVNQYERFRIWMSMSDDTENILLVDEHGDYDSTIVWIPQVDYLVIEADGTWSIVIPPVNWRGWVSYALEQLGGEAERKISDFEKMLRTLADELVDRVDSGKW